MNRIPSYPPPIKPLQSTGNQPLWSVMIPAYNCSEFLTDALNSVLVQDRGPEQMQIAVIDDASTDADVEALVRELGKGRVEYYRQPQNVGSLRNFETCINQARGQLVHLLHGDDRVRPGFYQKQTELFERYPEAGAAFCRVSYIDENGTYLLTQQPHMQEDGLLDNWLLRIAEKQRTQYVAMVVRRSVYEHLGSFFGVTYGEDWEMWTRIARHYPVAYTPQTLAEYRGHGTSISSDKLLKGKALEDLKKVIESIQQYIPEDKREEIKQKALTHCAHHSIASSIGTWQSYGTKNVAVGLWHAFKVSPGFSTFYFIIKSILKSLVKNTRQSTDKSVSATQPWDWQITSKSKWWDLDLGSIWSYRNLLARLVRRDFLVSYQQTLLGPFWALLQPILTVITYVLVFGKLVGISTGAIPPVIFYLSGTVLWNYFSEVYSGTASTFIANAELFSKVYFPRLIIPLSIISSQFLRLLIQLGLLLVVLIYFWVFEGLPVRVNYWAFFLPVGIVLIASISLSLGLILAVVTAKYRDLTNLGQLFIRMFMFVTPIIYPLSTVSPKNQWILALNPLTPVFEAFRYGLLGEGSFTVAQLGYSILWTGVLLLVGTLLFNKQKEVLMDYI